MIYFKRNNKIVIFFGNISNESGLIHQKQFLEEK